MAKWQMWLNSLSTPGGNLLLLAVFVSALLSLTVHVLHKDGQDSNQVTTDILSTFSGFSGALLQALRGRSTDVGAQPPNTTTTSTTTVAAQDVPKP